MPSKTSSSVKTINKVAKDTGIDKVVDAGKKLRVVEKGAKAAGTAIDKGAEAAGTAIDKGVTKIIKDQTGDVPNTTPACGWVYQMTPNKPQNYCGTDSMGSMKCKAECLSSKRNIVPAVGGTAQVQSPRPRRTALQGEEDVRRQGYGVDPVPVPEIDCNTVDYTAVPDSTTKKCTRRDRWVQEQSARRRNANGLWSGRKAAAGGSRVQCMADRGAT